MDENIMKMVAQARSNLERAGTVQDYLPLSERLTLMREAEEILSDALAQYDKSSKLDIDEAKEWIAAIEDTVTDNYAELSNSLDELEQRIARLQKEAEAGERNLARHIDGLCYWVGAIAERVPVSEQPPVVQDERKPRWRSVDHDPPEEDVAVWFACPDDSVDLGRVRHGDLFTWDWLPAPGVTHWLPLDEWALPPPPSWEGINYTEDRNDVLPKLDDIIKENVQTYELNGLRVIVTKGVPKDTIVLGEGGSHVWRTPDVTDV